jgi:hypothetical protein
MKKNARYLSVLLLFAVYVSTTCFAQQKIKITGKHTVAYTAKETITIDDTDGHALLISRIEGFNTNTGDDNFMDGAEVVVFGFGDYVKGNGPHQTYIKISLNKDVVWGKFGGKTSTILSDEGKPITKLEGIGSWIKGEGKYKGIQGNFTYKAKRVSKNMIINDWEGEYFIKK